jgi:hypothetical protein
VVLAYAPAARFALALLVRRTEPGALRESAAVRQVRRHRPRRQGSG